MEMKLLFVCFFVHEEKKYIYGHAKKKRKEKKAGEECAIAK
jgi:hypothetical protein